MSPSSAFPPLNPLSSKPHPTTSPLTISLPNELSESRPCINPSDGMSCCSCFIFLELEQGPG
jgi:hypothetical protein